MPDRLSLAQAMSSKPNVLLGIALACIASAAFSTGALVTYSTRWSRFSNEGSLVIALGFASGVVLSCSMSELLPEAQRSFELFMQQSGASSEDSNARASASFMAACAFVVGVVLTWAFDAACQCWATSHMAHHHSGASEMNAVPTQCDDFFRHKVDEEVKIHNLVVSSAWSLGSSSTGLYHIGVAKILGFAAQNVLVGAALLIATVQGKALGVSLGVAIALFIISESMALARFLANVAGMRWRAVQWCVVSSLSLPLGGSLATYIAVTTDVALPRICTGALFGVVSGLLVSLCVTQVLPICFTNARKQTSGISASVLTGVVFQASVRAMLLLTIVG